MTLSASHAAFSDPNRGESEMNSETLEALKGSIAKWERNAAAEKPVDITTHWSACPLCVLFNGDLIENRRDRCAGCPVFESVGQQFCEGTPFYSAVSARDTWQYDSSNTEWGNKARAAAAEELAFLKSLLPAPTPILPSAEMESGK